VASGAVDGAAGSLFTIRFFHHGKAFLNRQGFLNVIIAENQGHAFPPRRYFNVMTYPIQFGLSNHSLFDADFAASGLGLIL
jgi:hypothetical protein